MKIVTPAPSTPTYEITCIHCETVLECEKKDIQRRVDDQREGSAAVFVCMSCRGEIWVNTSVLPRDWRRR